MPTRSAFRLCLLVITILLGARSVAVAQNLDRLTQPADNRPTLAPDVRAQVSEAELRIRAQVRDYLRGTTSSLGDAPRLAAEVAAIRETYQAEWTNGDGEVGRWHEYVDAKQRVADLDVLAELNEQSKQAFGEVWDYDAKELFARARYRDMYSMGVRRRDLFEEHFGATHPLCLEANTAIGFCLLGQRKPAESVPYLTTAVNGLRSSLGVDHPATLDAIASLGFLRKVQGQVAETETLWIEALEGRQRIFGNGHLDTLTSMNDLGMLYREQGQLDKAEQYYLATLDGCQRLLGSDHPSTLRAKHATALVYLAQERENEAVPLLKEVLDSRRVVLGPEHPATLRSLQIVCAVLEQQGALAEAELHYAEALAIAQRLRADAVGDERGRAAMSEKIGLRQLAGRYATLLVRQGRYGDALTTSELGRGRALLDLIARSDTDIEAHLSESSDLRQAISEERRLRDEIVRLEDEIAAFRASRSSTREQDRAQGEQAERQLVENRRKLAEATTDVFLALQQVMPDAQPLNADQVQSRLEPGDLILGYNWMDDGVLLLTATRDTVSGQLIASGKPGVQSLGALISDVRAAMVDRTTAIDETRLTEVAQILFPPSVRQEIAAASRLLVLPDGPVTEIPLEVIATNPLDPIVDDVHQHLVYASSATIYLNRRSLGASRSDIDVTGHVVSLGGALFDRDAADLNEADLIMSMLERGRTRSAPVRSPLEEMRLHRIDLRSLPFSHAEALAVATLADRAGLSTRLLLGEDASIGMLEEAADGARFIHLATHGLVGSQRHPYHASLALTQPETPTPEDIGFLTLDHLIRAWRGKLDTCDLVVLSACDTQRGVRRGDALMSLPWGFYFAGAPTVVASLWQVDDSATAKLMTRFYANLLGAHDDPRMVGDVAYGRGDRMSKIDALQEAKRWLRDWEETDRGVTRPGVQGDDAPYRPYQHPYYWAGFVLMGDPGS